MAIPITNVGYGLTNALQNLTPLPIVSPRDPTSRDHAETGTIWVNSTSNAYFVATGAVAGATQWAAQSAGSGTFASVNITGGSGTVLTVQPTGNTVLGGDLMVSGSTAVEGFSAGANADFSGGTFTVNTDTNAITISDDADDTLLKFGTGAGVKDVFIGSSFGASSTAIHSGSNGLIIATGTGPIDFSADNSATTVNIATGAAAKLVTIGSITTTSSMDIFSGTGGTVLSSTGDTSIATDGALGLGAVGDITLVTTGGVIITPANGEFRAEPQPATAVGVGATSNSYLTKITIAGLTTAAPGSTTITFTNSTITATSAILCTATNLNASGNDALISVQGIIPGAGTADIVITNTGSGSLGTGDDVILTVWVLF